MTENEAINEIIKEVCSGCYGSDEEPHRCSTCGFRMAKDALEEIQRVKEIISSFPLDCGSTAEDIREIYRQLRGFLQIGTIEEFKDLKEKNEPKKPIDKSKNPTDWHVMACPCCEHVFWNSGQFVRYQPKFCNYCGQKLDWE